MTHGFGAENLPFPQASRWCWCAGLRTTIWELLCCHTAKGRIISFFFSSGYEKLNREYCQKKKEKIHDLQDCFCAWLFNYLKVLVCYFDSREEPVRPISAERKSPRLFMSPWKSLSDPSFVCWGWLLLQARPFCLQIYSISVFFILSPDMPSLSHTLLAKCKVSKAFKDSSSHHVKSKVFLLVFKTPCYLMSLYNHSPNSLTHSLPCSDWSLYCVTHT